jgi:benzoyl-CoA reductase/2-hydroxyglutaryl-CoA dehydratase subunit BcrC/BadD/HgdB
MRSLSQAFGTASNEDDIREAIEVVNRTRALLLALYEHRKPDPPAVGGAEVLRLVTEAARAPKVEFNRWLEGRPSEIDTRPSRGSSKPRLMLSGSIIDRPEIMELVEESGHVVAEDLCTSHRYLQGLVEVDRDPYEALARRYLQRAPCSRMIGLSERLDYVKMLIREYGAEGVIYHALKFCDQFQYDYPHLKRELDDMGVPVLYLEGDYTAGGFGQMRTRVQAFVEMLGDVL